MMLRDNVLLSHELRKRYGRKGIYPRCLFKIDIQKIYEFLEWLFLEEVLLDINFPKKFLDWIM